MDIPAKEAPRYPRDFAVNLAECGRLESAAVERVLKWHEERAEGIPQIIASLGLLPEAELADRLATYLDLPLATGEDYQEDLSLDTAWSAEFLRGARLLPTGDPDSLTLLMADPLDDFARRAVELKVGKPVSVKVAIASELDKALDRCLAGDGSQLQSIADGFASDDAATDTDEERLRDLASEAPVIRLVNLVVRRAAEARASDIHVEPSENRLRIRYRIDGVLRDVESPPAHLGAAILSRIKIMARLNIAERRLPQDGRIKTVVQGREMDIRVSTVPTLYGESAVLRLLDQAQGVYEFSDLGISPDNAETLLQLIEQPNGIVLVTGPTGSGKTTTLYSSLLHLNGPERKIITVEDPIEYQLDGVNQIQVKPQIGLGFADVLRAILRQDPDIIMVGEIRDLETAQIAVQAALTGHLVLSTVHTNTAAATITRLLDMGVEDYLLASTVTGVVAQRLVRRLCPHCRVPHRQDAALKKRFESRLTAIADVDKAFHQAVGCDKCNGTGYRGRVGVTEIMPFSETIQSMVLGRANAVEIAKTAQNEGMRTMFEDGLGKAVTGLTTLEEVLRVTRNI